MSVLTTASPIQRRKKKGDTYDHTIFHGTSLAGTISALPSFILTPLRD